MAVIAIVYFVNFGTADVNGTSMLPTLQNGDFLFMQRTKNVSRGDIIAVYSDKLDEMLIKRVIAVGGDHIVLNGDGVYVNDKLVKEDYIKDQDWENDNYYFDFYVGEDRVFVMGDNRNASTDSRSLGTFKKSKIYGKCILDITGKYKLNLSTLRKGLVIVWIFIVMYFVFMEFESSKRKNKSKKGRADDGE
jgi:signal peptidase I